MEPGEQTRKFGKGFTYAGLFQDQEPRLTSSQTPVAYYPHCPQTSRETLVSGQGNRKPATSPGTPVLTLCLDGIGIDRGIGSSGSPPRL